MILVKLKGGLSNQMFQYAAGRRLAHARGTQLKLDTGWFEHIPASTTKRTYELDVFPIEADIATPGEIAGTELLKNTNVREIPKAILRKLTGSLSYVEEKGFDFDPSILERPDNVCLDGYWISEKYFADIRAILLQEFIPKAASSESDLQIMKRMKAENSISVHVRRGDYVNNEMIRNIHGVLDTAYYERCFEYIRSKVKDPTWYFFSDDLQWMKDHLDPGGEVHYVHHNAPEKAVLDQQLMSHCRHQIIANSSFSWWGAWLNDHDDKIVCAPAQWALRKENNSDDIVPVAWKKF